MEKKVLISLIVVLLVISGCGGGTTFGKFGKSPDTDETTAKRDVYTGTEGLAFGFIKNLPPNEVFADVGSNIQLVAEVRNLGTKEVVGADFYLGGFDQNIVRIGADYRPLSRIEAKSEFLPEGGYQTIPFSSTELSLPAGTDEYKPKFILTACYEYETLANPIVCIDPNKHKPTVDEQSACKEQDVSMGGGQGAPVGVNRVSVDSSLDKIFFKIDISNVGKGKVVNKAVTIGGQQGKCPFDLDFSDVDEVHYTVTLSGQAPLGCSPQIDGLGGSNKVRLTDNKGTVTCSFRKPSENKFAYTTPLQIRLNYGYTESTSAKEVRIYKVGR